MLRTIDGSPDCAIVLVRGGNTVSDWMSDCLAAQRLAH